MNRSRSDGQIFDTRRSLIGRHYEKAAPGFTGHIPASRCEPSTVGSGFARTIEQSKVDRSYRTWDPQAHRIQREEFDRRTRTTIAAPTAPQYDARGISYPAAGDTLHSRVPASGEEKVHFHSSMGLTSAAYENIGGAASLKGYGHASIGIPGYTGYIPGKAAENVFADTWSKTQEKSVVTHFAARSKAPKQCTLITEGRTAVPAVRSDTLAEVPIHNPSYQDQARGWSDCRFTGKDVAPAGRQAPYGRQEGFGLTTPLVNQMGFQGMIPIHGYAGFVPGRVGESVVGERQCKTNAISDHLFKKNRLRITQR